MNLTDITVVNSGHRHLVCNGSAEVGWLTACGDRVKNGWPAERRDIREIKCPGCQRFMAENDY